MSKVIASALFLMVIGCISLESPAQGQIEKTETRTTDDKIATKIDDKIEEKYKDNNCRDGMVHIHGNYCPRDNARCNYWVDLDGKRTNIETDRCGEWSTNIKCLVPTVYKDFCMDKFRYPNKEGERPMTWLSYYDAEKIANKEGKRLCTESEFAFAALGEENAQYPFGDYRHRDHSCNIDNHAHGLDVFKAKDPNDDTALALQQMQSPAGSLPDCVSIFGVHDMVGGCDTWVKSEEGGQYISGLMGGHLFGVRNRSRAITTGHGPTFYWYETGLSLCSNIEETH